MWTYIVELEECLAEIKEWHAEMQAELDAELEAESHLPPECRFDDSYF